MLSNKDPISDYNWLEGTDCTSSIGVEILSHEMYHCLKTEVCTQKALDQLLMPEQMR